MAKNARKNIELLKYLPLILEHAAIDAMAAAHTWSEDYEPQRSMSIAFAAMIDGTANADEAVRIAVHNAQHYKALVEHDIELADAARLRSSLVDNSRREFTLKPGVTIEQYEAASKRHADLKANPPAGAYIITGKAQEE